MARKSSPRRSEPARPAPDPAPTPSPEAAAPRFHRIVRVEVAGGFLDGLDLELDPHLDCIIGGRGTGKSTAFELLRYVFQDPATRASPKVSWALGSGRVRVQVETRDGGRYWIERTLHGGPEVTDGEGNPVKLAPSRLMDVVAFGQGELERVADSPEQQLALLDRFAGDDLERLRGELTETESALRANAETVDRAAAAVRRLEEETARLPELTRRLAELPEVGGAHAARIKEQLALKGSRDRELLLLERMLAAQGDQRRLLEAARGALVRALDPVPDDLLSGANGPILAGAREAVSAAERACARGLDQAQSALDELEGKLGAQRGALEAAHGEQDGRYREALALQAQEKGKAHERVALQRQVYELQAQDQARQERARELEALLQARRGLLSRLSLLRDERTSVRRRVAEDLTRRLAPSIQVRITSGAVRTAYRDLIDQVLKEESKGVAPLVKAVVASSLVPRELARLVQAGDRDRLEQELEVKPDRVDLLLQALRDKPAVWQIETCDLGDLPRIELQHEGEWKEASTLSSGLRCTALLPILLLESSAPLLVDQPEDDLDGQSLVEQVVLRLLEVKRGRQLLFVTHNPNLVVIGEAERVFRLGLAGGGRGRVVAAGSTEQLKDHIEGLLEGGREAFQRRMRHYER